MRWQLRYHQHPQHQEESPIQIIIVIGTITEEGTTEAMLTLDEIEAKEKGPTHNGIEHQEGQMVDSKESVIDVENQDIWHDTVEVKSHQL